MQPVWGGKPSTLISHCIRHRRNAAVYRNSRRVVIKGAQLSADDGPSQQGGALVPTRPPKTLLRIHARRPVWTYVVSCLVCCSASATRVYVFSPNQHLLLVCVYFYTPNRLLRLTSAF